MRPDKARSVVNNMLFNLKHFKNICLEQILPIKRRRSTFYLFKRYICDLSRYSNLPGSERIHFLDTFPCLFDNTKETPIDPHYFYQDIWAFKAIKKSGAVIHVDVGSRAIFVGILTAITKITFVDIRPFEAKLDNFQSIPGSILALPFKDNSVPSLSCLHVGEHIGLGRYGDALDPGGTKKASRELSRILAPNGNLYFSLPIGKPRVCFNAHRIHNPQQIFEYFNNLELISFSGIDDNGIFKKNINPIDLSASKYACGLFHFTKSIREID